MEPVKSGVKMDNPEKRVLILRVNKVLHAFDYETQLADAIRFLHESDNKHWLTAFYIGEQDGIVNFPTNDNFGGSIWTGWARTEKEYHDFITDTLVDAIEAIPEGAYEAYAYKTNLGGTTKQKWTPVTEDNPL